MSQLASFGIADSDLAPRLKFVNVLPTAILLIIVASLLLSGAPANAPSFEALVDNAGHYGWVGAALATAGSLVVGLLLQPLELASIQVLEGYWGRSGPLAPLAAFGSWMQERRKSRLDWVIDHLTDRLPLLADSAAQKLDLLPDANLLPTKLGNRLRAAEDRAGAPYGLDAVMAWPRLFFSLPEDALQKVTEYRNQLDIAVRLCITFGLGALITTALLVLHPLWLAVPAICALLSWFAYHAALHAATTYGIAFTAAIDVYRMKLLRDLSLKMPANTDEERDINGKLMALWERRGGWPAPVDYAPAGDSDTSSDPA
ncbi:hypothetical protein [Streptomyces sp. NBC_01615]|uniref:hypothetical protein n=1 Tax=Streptomyces sp. NBC_01615 TaxID=2975898 RepID=UPI00386DDAD6